MLDFKTIISYERLEPEPIAQKYDETHNSDSEEEYLQEIANYYSSSIDGFHLSSQASQASQAYQASQPSQNAGETVEYLGIKELYPTISQDQSSENFETIENMYGIDTKRVALECDEERHHSAPRSMGLLSSLQRNSRLKQFECDKEKNETLRCKQFEYDTTTTTTITNDNDDDDNDDDDDDDDDGQTTIAKEPSHVLRDISNLQNPPFSREISLKATQGHTEKTVCASFLTTSQDELKSANVTKRKRNEGKCADEYVLPSKRATQPHRNKSRNTTKFGIGARKQFVPPSALKTKPKPTTKPKSKGKRPTAASLAHPVVFDNPFNTDFCDIIEGDDTILEPPRSRMKSKAKPRIERKETYSDSELTTLLNEYFSFSSFRKGQCEVIQNILSKHSSLFISPTGSGKSLCYQFPALLQSPHTFTLVITPLLSLIADQLLHLNVNLRGACLGGTNTSRDQNTSVMRRLKKGDIDIVFVSPEKACTPSFATHINAPGMPRISFCCIDEIHCVSEWGHNFRTSYIRLKKILQCELGVDTILGMTATATRKTEQNICEIFSICPENIVRTEGALNHNLTLTFSVSQNKKADLLALLKKIPENERKIIIYVMFQWQAEDLAQYLSSHMYETYAYHGGMNGAQRKRAQKCFLSDSAQIICATVAFGMGLNKADVRGIIHYSLPKSIENYVQEVGRAGRDGLPCWGNLLVDVEDYFRLRSFAHSDGIDKWSIDALLSRIFSPQKAKAKRLNLKYPYHVALSIQKTQFDLDLKKETILTLLSYMENQGLIEILPEISIRCLLNFHKKPPIQLARKDETFALLTNFFKKGLRGYEFDSVAVSNAIGLTIPTILACIARLKSKGELSYDVFEPALYLMVLKPVKKDQRTEILDHLYSKMKALEDLRVNKVDEMHSLCSKKEEEIRTYITRYFEEENASDIQTSQPFPLPLPPSNTALIKRKLLIGDIRVFLSRCQGEIDSARALARIFHGIPSIKYPSHEWNKNPFWKRHFEFDFSDLMRIAEKILKDMKKL